MSSNVFRKRGFKAHEVESKRREEEKEKAVGRLWRYFLKDKEEECPIRFLTEEPILFYEHSLQLPGGKYGNETCIGADEGCVHCAKGDKPGYKGAWLVVDGREYTYKDKNGKEQTGSDQIRLYVRGSQDIAKLDRLSKKYGLTARPWFATKTGTGTSTSYELDRGDEGVLTNKELLNLFARLPDKMKSHADPSDIETLYDIVEFNIFDDVTLGDEEPSDEPDEKEADIDSGVRKVNDAPKKKTIFKKKK